MNTLPLEPTLTVGYSISYNQPKNNMADIQTCENRAQQLMQGPEIMHSNNLQKNMKLL
jgi:hypothetical protein